MLAKRVIFHFFTWLIFDSLKFELGHQQTSATLRLYLHMLIIPVTPNIADY